MENEKDNETGKKHDADSGSDSTNEMIQQEKLIDPGNEHHHDGEHYDEPANAGPKLDADAGGDGAGTMASKPE